MVGVAVNVTLLPEQVGFTPVVIAILTEGVTGAVRVITTSSKFEQVPLEIVHRKVLAPTPSPVTPDVGLFKDVILPEPLIKVHVPVPTVAMFPASVAVAAQTV